MWIWGAIGAPRLFVWTAWELQLYDVYMPDVGSFERPLALDVALLWWTSSLIALCVGVVWSTSLAVADANDRAVSSARPAGDGPSRSAPPLQPHSEPKVRRNNP